MKHPTKIFKDGKRKMLDSKRQIREHEKRNDLIWGSDDLDQEALKNKKERQLKAADEAIDGAFEEIQQKGIFRK